MSGLGRFAIALAVVAGVAAPARSAESLRLRPAGGIYVDSKGAGLRLPEGVACGPDHLLAVADTGNGRLVLYDVRNDAVIPRTEFSVAELPEPIRVEVDSKGLLFVLDGKLRQIGKVSAAGEFRGFVNLSAAGEAVVPRSFRLDAGGNLVILDVAGWRLLTVGADGKAAREVPLPEGEAAFYSDLAVDARGTVYVLDSVGGRVLVVRADGGAATQLGGDLRGDLDFATSLALDGDGHLLLSDQNGGGIAILNPDGSFLGRQSVLGWKEGQLRYPAAICLDGRGLLFVADRGNSRVEIFDIVR